MSVNSIVNDLLNNTSTQQALDRQKEISDSFDNPQRNAGGVMGKNDFLMLLSAQLRYQNPLDPNNDADFAAQLAQFSSLEQMMNMNTTMTTLAQQQTYALVGKGVMGMTDIDGEFQAFAGIVDNIFTDTKGVQWAVIREEQGTLLQVPVSAISGTFDAENQLTPEKFINISNNLIGRNVTAEWEEVTYNGVVTKVTVDRGQMWATIQHAGGSILVPVGAIIELGEMTSAANALLSNISQQLENLLSND